MVPLALLAAPLLAGSLLARVPALAPADGGGAGAPSPSEDPADLLAEAIVARGDALDPRLLTELAELGTPRAAARLADCYDLLATLHARRIAVRGLARFGGVPGAEAVALDKLLAIATASAARELREEALDALAAYPSRGKACLAMVVESPAHDEVRVGAMRRHVSEPRDADLGWYRALWEGERRVAERRGFGGGDRDAEPRALPEVRALAFGPLASTLSDGELRAALHDRQREVRLHAATELVRRGEPGSETALQEVYLRTDEWPRVRAEAARGLAALRGEKVLRRFARDGGAPRTPYSLRAALASIVAAALSPELERRVLELAEDRHSAGRLFALAVLAEAGSVHAPAVARALLGDEDTLVRAGACEVLASRGAAGATAELEELVLADPHPGPAGAAFRALSELRSGDPSWFELVLELARSEREVTRNAAIVELGRRGDPRHLPELARALEHDAWTTRLAAVRALEASRSEYAVGALVLRLGREEGRLAREIADALWRLTGRPFGVAAHAWRGWWVEEVGRFRVPDAGELARLQAEARHRRESLRTRAEFFGVRVETTRAAFVLDVSGSMAGSTLGRYVGESGPSRLAVAKRELSRTLSALGRRAFFNLVPFSDAPRPWKPRLVEWNERHLAEAEEAVSSLTAGGATDLFGALLAALDDPDVDTVFVLSDGEPAGAAVTDPAEIRRRIAARNEHRGVVLHCIAVGGRLELLEWLAADSGGSYARVP